MLRVENKVPGEHNDTHDKKTKSCPFLINKCEKLIPEGRCITEPSPNLRILAGC